MQSNTKHAQGKIIGPTSSTPFRVQGLAMGKKLKEEKIECDKEESEKQYYGRKIKVYEKKNEREVRSESMKV